MSKQEPPITQGQLGMLHAVCKAARLKWVSRNVGREITSFKNLTKAEGSMLLAIAKAELEKIP